MGDAQKNLNALKFTRELGHEICVRVESIGFENVAAERVGVHRNTVRNWRERGEAGEELYLDFARELAMAKATYAERTLGKVEDPKWLLERLDRKTFGPQQDVNLKGDLNITDYRNKSTEELRQLAQNALEGVEDDSTESDV